jgi:hypothetical protein
MPHDYERTNKIFKEEFISFLRCKVHFTDELIQYAIFLSNKKKRRGKDFSFLFLSSR